VCFNGKAEYENEPKQGNGLGSLGRDTGPLFAFAQEVVGVLRDRFPELIGEQILRIDFWRHIKTNQYFLNEVEGKYHLII
jgi:hypothetical protein